MKNAILTLNAGSSSLKFGLYGEGAGGDVAAIAEGHIDAIGAAPHLRIRDGQGAVVVDRALACDSDYDALLAVVLEWVEGRTGGLDLAAVGHRVVHGGQEFSAPVRVNDTILAKLTALIPLAPLHQPNNLAAIRALAKARPALVQVACFDTGFHATNTPAVTSYALPRALTQEGVRRYGFHGLSYEYIASRLPEFLGPTASGRVVVAHLGHGASMCAMRARRSLATTMGMTALDGLVMGRRCGAIDPGVLLYLMDEKAMGYDELTDLLYRRSGLLGVSQISDDMRTLLKSPAKEAREAVDMFIYRIGRELGSLAAALGGLDALVFTGGIGEHASAIRAGVGRDAAWLGVVLDEAANDAGGPRISAPDSKVAVYVIATNEDLMIARHALRLLKAPPMGTEKGVSR